MAVLVSMSRITAKSATMTSSLGSPQRLPLTKIETSEGWIFSDISLDEDELLAFMSHIHDNKGRQRFRYFYWGGEKCRVNRGQVEKLIKDRWVPVQFS